MTVMASIWTAHVRAASASLLPVSRLSEALELLLQNPLFSHFHVLCFFFFFFQLPLLIRVLLPSRFEFCGMGISFGRN